MPGAAPAGYGVPVWLLLVPLAVAHRPHAVVRALVAEGDGGEAGAAWAIVDPGGAAGLLRSDDDGAHWDWVGGAPQAADPVDLAWVAGGLVAVGADGTVWQEEGGGWTSFALDGGGLVPRAVAASAEGLAIATDDGVWVGDPDDPPSFVALAAGTAFVDLRVAADDPGALVAVDADGQAWLRPDAASPLALLPAPPGRVVDADLAGGVIWAGTSFGAFRWTGEAWEPCATPPSAVAGDTTAAMVRAEPDGTLWIATAEDALFQSRDGCASFTRLPAAEVLEVSYGGTGGAQDPSDQWTDLATDGLTLVLAGFGGVARSADGGATWSAPKLVRADYVRGLALAPAWPGDPRILLGLYGGGTAWTETGGERWNGGATGLLGPYNQELSVDPDFATSHRAWWAAPPYAPARSDDGGRTWTALETAFAHTRGVRARGGRHFLLGEVEAGDAGDGVYEGLLAWSADGGETWTELSRLDAATGTATPQEVALLEAGDEAWILVSTDRPARVVRGTFDDTWTVLGEGGDEERSAGVVVWGGTRVVWAASDLGVRLWDVGDSAEPAWVAPTVPPGGHPRRLQASAGGTLLLVDQGSQFWRSDDGGDTWYAVGGPVPPPTLDFSLAADFDASGAAIQGTTAGVWWTTDGGATWTRLPHYERFENGTHHLSCTGACAIAGTGTMQSPGWWRMAELAEARFTFEGTWFRMELHAPTSPGELVVYDGEVAVGTLSTDQPTFAGLAPGWHDIRLVVAAGEVGLDAVEVGGGGGAPMVLPSPPDTGETGETGETGAVDSAPPDRPVRPSRPTDPSGCGCGGASASPRLGALFGLLALRRQRRFAFSFFSQACRGSK